MFDLDQERSRRLSGPGIFGVVIADHHSWDHSAKEGFVSRVARDPGGFASSCRWLMRPARGSRDVVSMQVLQSVDDAFPWGQEPSCEQGARFLPSFGFALFNSTGDPLIRLVRGLTERESLNTVRRGHRPPSRLPNNGSPLIYLIVFRADETMATAGPATPRSQPRPERSQVHSSHNAEVSHADATVRAEALGGLVAGKSKVASEAYQTRLKQLTGRLARAEEAERQRISAHLHDHLGQPLAMLKLRLASMREQVASAKLGKHLAEMEAEVGHLITTTRSLTAELSPPVLRELGLVPALRSLCRHNETLTGVKFTLQDHITGDLENMSRMIAYRVIRELLFNAIKHSRCRHVSIEVREVESVMEIAVADDGIGLSQADGKNMDSLAAGFGLFNAREQLDQLGGSLCLESSPGKGTLATVTIPLGDRR